MAQVFLLPRGLGAAPGGYVGEGLEEQIVPQREICRPGAQRRIVHRMPVFMDEFVEHEQSPLFVVGRYARLHGMPGGADLPADADLIRVCERRLVWPDVEVMLHPEPVQVGAQIPVEALSDRQYGVSGDGG